MCLESGLVRRRGGGNSHPSRVARPGTLTSAVSKRSRVLSGPVTLRTVCWALLPREAAEL